MITATNRDVKAAGMKACFVMTLPAMIVLAEPCPGQCPPSWAALGSGVSSQCNVVATWDPDGAGPMHAVLLAGGPFEMAGGINLNNIAQWDGKEWSALDQGVTGEFPTVYGIAEFDEDGAGPLPPALFVGGEFFSASGVAVSNIARWNGASWSALGAPGSGTDGLILSLFVFDDDGPGSNPPALYVGGNFSFAGGVFSPGIARWNGASWSSVGGGVSGGFLEVSALQGFDEDGAGPNPARLFIGGDFTHAGGIPASRIARWDGTTWSSVGGTSGFVHDMVVFDDDGPGLNAPALYVGGAFNMAGGVIVAGIGRWNGTNWSSLSSTVNAPVQALSVFDEDGAGPGMPAMYAGGNFTFAGGIAGTNKIARWNGTSWSSVGGGITGSAVLEMVPIDPDGPGAGTLPASLAVCGVFATAGAVPVSRIAQWIGCEAGPGDVNGNGMVNIDDLLAVINAWGACPAPCPPSCGADLDHNCTVNIDDLLTVINNWG